MSRGLQMLVEEGGHSSCVHAVWSVGKQNLPPFFAEMSVGSKTVHGFCRNERRGAKPSTVFAEIGLGRQNRPRFSSKNGKNRLSSTDDERKTVKTTFHPRMMSQK